MAAVDDLPFPYDDFGDLAIVRKLSRSAVVSSSVRSS
jgi:hypothetical protein